MCGGGVEQVLDLGTPSLSGVFPKPNERVPTAPLKVVLCKGECGLPQLSHTYPLGEMYGDGYGYRSGLNGGMVEHLKGVALRLSRYLQPGDVVVDVGSSDGTLLGAMPVDCVRYGVDPSARKFSRIFPPNIHTIFEFFPSPTLTGMLDGRKCKLVTSIAMFYDLERPVEFAHEVYNTLTDDGVWYLECSYWPTLMSIGAFDTICHEHLEYYGFRQLAWIARAAGFHINHYEFNSVNGGSVALRLSKHGPDVELPSDLFASDPYSYVVLGQRMRRSRGKLWDLLDRKKMHKQRVAGYGASTKGNTLLHYYRLSFEDLDFIVDVNEDKWGRVTPGTHIPIVGEGEADAYLVLPWHFREGILVKEKGKTLIFPLPDVEEVLV